MGTKTHTTRKAQANGGCRAQGMEKQLKGKRKTLSKIGRVAVQFACFGGVRLKRAGSMKGTANSNERVSEHVSNIEETCGRLNQEKKKS